MSGNFLKFTLAILLIVAAVSADKWRVKGEERIGAVPAGRQAALSGLGGTDAPAKNRIAAPPIFVLSSESQKETGGDLPQQILDQKSLGELWSASQKISALLPENVFNSQTEKPAASPAGFAAASSRPASPPSAISGAAAPAGVFILKKDMAAPQLTAQAAMLADLKTGESYFELNPAWQWPVASITKLVTAAVALRNVDLNQNITLSADDFLVDDNAANKNLKIGETMNAGDLLRVMLLVSSNEAAEALARVYGRENFLALMNSFARENGAESTFFKDPTGLSVSNQSTLRDLRRLAAAILEKYPEIFKITQTPKLEFKDAASGAVKIAANINQFAGQAEFLGGKTGYIDESGENLLSLFSSEGRPVFIAVLGSADRFGETSKLLQWLKETYKLNTQQ